MVSFLHDPAAGQHKDPVRPLYGGKAVGDGECGTPFCQLFQGLGYKEFTLIVKSRGGLVQDQDSRIL